MMKTGERIKTKRKGLGVTQEGLAEKANVSVMTVFRWEQELRSPRGDELQRLASALNTTSAYLLGETDDPAPSGQAVQQLTLPEAKSSFTTEQGTQYKNEITASRGMLRYKFQDGSELELPDTPDNKGFFFELIKNDRKLIGLQPVGSM